MAQPAADRRRILLVESEPVVAMDLAAQFSDHGLQVIGPFSRCGDALAWLADGEPDCAVIGVAPRDGFGFEIARELRRRGVPFAFFSGAEEFEPEVAREWRGTPWVGKPIASCRLVRILEGLLCRRGVADAAGRERVG